MTQPTPHGYPDYNRTATRADKRYMRILDASTGNPTTYTLGFVGDQPYLGFWLQSNTLGNTFVFDFLADAITNISDASYGFSLPLNASAIRTIPIQGPYARLRVTQSAAGATHQAIVWSQSLSTINNLGASDQNVLFSVSGQAIAAGATLTLDSLVSSPGEAVWHVTSGSAAWRATLSAVFANGTTRGIASLQTTATQINGERRVFLPATAYRLAITNNGGAAANFDTYVTARPIEPGA